MSYHKIEVDGTEYQYTIGKAYVKVRGLGAWLKEDIGVKVDRDFEGDGYGTVEVYPSHIVSKIRETVRLNT